MSDENGKAHFGVIGLNRYTEDLSLEMCSRGFTGIVYHIDPEKIEDFFDNEAKDKKIYVAQSLEDLILKVKEPRCLVLSLKDSMVKSLMGVDCKIDDFIDIHLLPYLSPMDYVVDSGISNPAEITKRIADLLGKGIRYVSLKESPSADFLSGICTCLADSQMWLWYCLQKMPRPIDQRESFEFHLPKVNSTTDTCCIWGNDGYSIYASQYIQKKNMWQDDKLILEADVLLSKLAQLNEEQKSYVFADWCKTELNSQFYQTKSIPLASAVPLFTSEQKSMIEHIRKAMLALQIIQYSLSYATIREIDDMHRWGIVYADIHPVPAEHYRFKCALYRKIKTAFKENPGLANLLEVDEFHHVVKEGLPSIKEIVEKVSRKERELGEKLNVKNIFRAYSYFNDFKANMPICWRLVDEEVAHDEGLLPLRQYQYQLRDLQLLIEKIEKAVLSHSVGQTSYEIAKMNEDLSQSEYFACIKHLGKDEKVLPRVVNKLWKRINDVRDILKNAV